MPDVWLLLFFFIAIFVGWLLGRFSHRKPADTYPRSQALNRDYFVGLDHLLNEKTDAAIDSFIRALEVNSDTIPAHLALAKLFRKKGDVDRAINIHQTLLARPSLSRSDSLKIQMALARDYDAIGLLDRSENLLHEIIRQHPPLEMRRNALVLLTKLYEKEKEWTLALETAEKISLDRATELKKDLAHYCCELADESYRLNKLRDAAIKLRKAYEFDPDSVRASLLFADVLMAQKQWKQAIKAIRQIEKQDKLFIPEGLSRLKRCYVELNQLYEFEVYLSHLLDVAPSASVILAMAERIEKDRDVLSSGKFIIGELKDRPSIKGFNRLIDMYIEHGSESAKESLQTLRNLTATLELSKPRYLCGSCGYSSKTLAWQCPSCKKWGSHKPIQGLEGE